MGGTAIRARWAHRTANAFGVTLTKNRRSGDCRGDASLSHFPWRDFYRTTANDAVIRLTEKGDLVWMRGPGGVGKMSRVTNGTATMPLGAVDRW